MTYQLEECVRQNPLVTEMLKKKAEQLQEEMKRIQYPAEERTMVLLRGLLETGIWFDHKQYEIFSYVYGDKSYLCLRPVQVPSEVASNFHLQEQCNASSSEDTPPVDAFQSSKPVIYSIAEMAEQFCINPNKGLGIIPDKNKPSFK